MFEVCKLYLLIIKVHCVCGCCFSLAGCPEAAVSNINNAIQAAVSSGAVGVTVSHWSGIGHVTHYPMSLTGILILAGLSWNSQISLVSTIR